MNLILFLLTINSFVRYKAQSPNPTPNPTNPTPGPTSQPTIYNNISLELKEPQQIIISDITLNLTVKGKYITLVNHENSLNITFNTRVYCWPSNGTGDEICDIPGPTWIMKPGKTNSILLRNNLTGFGTTGPVKLAVSGDFDVTNMHTHGLHDNPQTDDIWNVWVNPMCPSGFDSNSGRNCNTKRSKLYAYDILDIHYPGTHWYHAHWPGSVSYQVGGGLYGLIRMLANESYISSEPVFTKEFDILSSFAWFVNTKACLVDNVKNHFKDSRGKYPLNFPVQSLCILWNDATTTDPNGLGNSSTPYNVSIKHFDGSDYLGDIKLFVVNGQVNPYVKLQTYHWYRFRIVSITMNYLLFDVSGITDNCQFYLMGNDGIYFETGSRNIRDTPYNDTTIIVPGSRADIAVRCNKTGIYQIIASSNSRGLDGIKFGPVPRHDGRLIQLRVIDNTTIYSGTYNTSFKFLDYSVSPYLSDTLIANKTYRNLTSQCDTIDYNQSEPIYNLSNSGIVGYQEALTQCNLVLTRKCYPPGIGGPGVGVCSMSLDQIRFDATKYLMRIESNKTHEWSILSNYHPFHHHTWPFQIQRQITNGWIAEKGDWRDTVGASSSFIARVNYVDYYNTTLITHCHFVPHEDKGMMAKIRLLPLGEKLDTSKIIPKNSAILNTEQPDSTLLPKKLCPIGRHSITCISINDINSNLVLLLNIKYTNKRCIFHINSGMELRHAPPQNFWYGFGIGDESYSDTQNLTHGFSKAKMKGKAFIFEYNLFNINDNHIVNTYEAQLNTGTYVIEINKTTNINCTKKGYRYNNSRLYLGTKCHKILYTKDEKILNLINTTIKNQTFLWAYGEGAFTNYSMHSARNPCGVLWNTGDIQPNKSVALHCEQTQGSLGTRIDKYSGTDKCSFILRQFELIIFSGNNNNSNNNLALIIGLSVGLSILFIVIIVVISWYYYTTTQSTPLQVGNTSAAPTPKETQQNQETQVELS